MKSCTALICRILTQTVVHEGTTLEATSAQGGTDHHTTRNEAQEKCPMGIPATDTTDTTDTIDTTTTPETDSATHIAL